MMKVTELVGYESVKALNVYSAVLIGGKNIPDYVHLPFETYFQTIAAKSPAERENFFRVASALVPLERDEIEAITQFCLDPNGVPFQRAQLKSMPLKDIFEIIVAVCVHISQFKIDFVSTAEKKN